MRNLNDLRLRASGAAGAAGAATPDSSPSPSPLAHVRNRFEFLLHAYPADVAPLFGAWGERAWADGWEPRFLYPDPPADQAGAVFTVAHSSHESTWITTIFEPSEGHVQHVHFIAGVMVTLIDVRFAERERGTTSVEVIYERTALSPAANAHVVTKGNEDAAAGPSWKTAIEKTLPKAAG